MKLRKADSLARFTDTQFFTWADWDTPGTDWGGGYMPSACSRVNLFVRASECEVFWLVGSRHSQLAGAADWRWFELMRVVLVSEMLMRAVSLASRYAKIGGVV